MRFELTITRLSSQADPSSPCRRAIVSSNHITHTYVILPWKVLSTHHYFLVWSPLLITCYLVIKPLYHPTPPSTLQLSPSSTLQPPHSNSLPTSPHPKPTHSPAVRWLPRCDRSPGFQESALRFAGVRHVLLTRRCRSRFRVVRCAMCTGAARHPSSVGALVEGGGVWWLASGVQEVVSG